MQLRAKLSSVDGKAPTSQDGPNKIGLKFAPLYLGEDDASWLFEHLGRWLTLDISLQPPPPTPMEEAIEASRNGHDDGEPVPAAGRRRRGTRADATEGE